MYKNLRMKLCCDTLLVLLFLHGGGSTTEEDCDRGKALKKASFLYILPNH